MKKTYMTFIILFAFLIATVAIPKVTTEALAAPVRTLSSQTIFTELTLPDSSTILFVTTQLDDSGSATKAGEIPSIIAELEQADSGIDLSQYSYVYYHELALGGEMLAGYIFNVAASHWIHLSIDPHNPATEPNGDASLGRHEIGPYVLDITGIERGIAYDDEEVITIILSFTNNSDETESFELALSYEAFQNGIEIDRGFLSEEDNLYRNVRSGATLNDIKLSFKINDSSPVTVEFSELFSFNNENLIEITFDVPVK